MIETVDRRAKACVQTGAKKIWSATSANQTPKLRLPKLYQWVPNKRKINHDHDFQSRHARGTERKQFDNP